MVLPLNPNRSLDNNVSGILVFVLFPNIFYFLIVILSVFVTWRSQIRLRYKNKQSTWQ